MNPSKRNSLRALFLGGVLPVVVFTGIEEIYGTVWGLIAGMAFGIGEILWEKFSKGKVDLITWIGNGLLLFLGGISLVSQEGVWFKLQPALLEIGIVVVLWGSLVLKRPFLWMLMQKQAGFLSPGGPQLRPGLDIYLQRAFRGLTFRLGLFFFFHAILATWAALHWSTSAWALLKGVGLTLSLIIYMVVESLVLRYRIATIP